MTDLRWHIAVLIPARDEEELLPRCLKSIQRARLHLPAYVSSDVVVVSDRSADQTRSCAERILKDSGVVLGTMAGCAGTARALAARVALRRYSGVLERCWLANTDADCELPESWLRDQIAVAARGYSAVAGTVNVDSFVGHEAAVEQRFRLTYTINPDGTHPHVHGANLGVRADAYIQAGGWSDLATGEDHDLWGRLKLGGHRHLSDASLKVITSGRRLGRAPSGFAQALGAHNESVAS